MFFNVLSALVVAFEGAFLVYFLTLNSLYLLFAIIAFFELGGIGAAGPPAISM